MVCWLLEMENKYFLMRKISSNFAFANQVHLTRNGAREMWDEIQACGSLASSSRPIPGSRCVVSLPFCSTSNFKINFLSHGRFSVFPCDWTQTRNEKWTHEEQLMSFDKGFEHDLGEGNRIYLGEQTKGGRSVVPHFIAKTTDVDANEI